MIKRSLIVLTAAFAVASPASAAEVRPDLSQLNPLLCDVQRLAGPVFTLGGHSGNLECIGWPDHRRSAGSDVVTCTVRWATHPELDQTYSCVDPTRRSRPVDPVGTANHLLCQVQGAVHDATSPPDDPMPYVCARVDLPPQG